jgi:hypothetical protein
MRRIIATIVGGLAAAAIAASVGVAVAASSAPTPNGGLPACCVR